jgi:hypothetical protein
MSITTVDDIAAGIALATQYGILKNFTAPKAIGSFQSGWLGTGFPGAGAASPAFTAGSGYTCDRTTAGALAQTNGVTQNWLGRLFASTSIAGTLLIYDRLWSCSGMGFAASTYTVTTPGSLPARITDNGIGVQAFIEQFVAAGAASGTATLNYLNTAGSAKSGVISAVVSAPVVGQLQPIPWQSGDAGVKQVTSIVTSATWTSGTFGVTLLKPIAAIPLPVAGVGASFDWSQILAKIPADACVTFAWLASSTTAPTIYSNAWIMDK